MPSLNLCNNINLNKTITILCCVYRLLFHKHCAGIFIPLIMGNANLSRNFRFAVFIYDSTLKNNFYNLIHKVYDVIILGIFSFLHKKQFRYIFYKLLVGMFVTRSRADLELILMIFFLLGWGTDSPSPRDGMQNRRNIFHSYTNVAPQNNVIKISSVGSGFMTKITTI